MAKCKKRKPRLPQRLLEIDQRLSYVMVAESKGKSKLKPKSRGGES